MIKEFSGFGPWRANQELGVPNDLEFVWFHGDHRIGKRRFRKSKAQEAAGADYIYWTKILFFANMQAGIEADIDDFFWFVRDQYLVENAVTWSAMTGLAFWGTANSHS